MTVEIEQKTNPGICRKPINDLLGEQFLIPDYQRGFRWEEQQVLDLLEDVHDFFKPNGDENKGSFYCLQPIVVKAQEDSAKWEVVDGQQRLTTIYLILQSFNLRFIEEERTQLYTISFETRELSAEFLSNPTEERSSEYIDFHFMFQAMKTIKDWFKDRKNIIGDFESTLLNRVQVIWYELPKTEIAVDAFTRLNVGKIPLTNAELVRALFLRSKNFPQTTAELEQLKIAQEWDSMERSLQDDDFWYFLTENDDRANRIELIFNLITQDNPSENEKPGNKLKEFHRFNELIHVEKVKPEKLWDDVKQFYMTLHEWFADPVLFHLIGFLINENAKLLDLIRLSEESSKTQFKNELRSRIRTKLFPSVDFDENDPSVFRTALGKDLDEISYGSPRVKPILLLFNIASIISNEKSILRFRFDYFKNEKWDIEHIRSVESGRPQSNRDKKPWLEAVRDYFQETDGDEDLHKRASEMISSQTYTMGDDFDKFYDEVIRLLDEESSTDVENGIGNLALLDSGTNRGYKNAVFPIKRYKILQTDQAGTFVPLCTRNVFLKCYSKKLENMFVWASEDQDDYRNAIADKFLEFFVS